MKLHGESVGDGELSWLIHYTLTPFHEWRGEVVFSSHMEKIIFFYALKMHVFE